MEQYFQVGNMWEKDKLPLHPQMRVSDVPFLPTNRTPSVTRAAEFQKVMDSIPSFVPMPDLYLLHHLAHILADTGRYYMEIGSFCGKSAVAANIDLGDIHWGKSILVDLWDFDRKKKFMGMDISQITNMRVFCQNIVEQHAPAKYEFIQGDFYNHETKEAVRKATEGLKYGMVLIDGDHSYLHCDMDYEAYVQQQCPVGGIVAFHDYCKQFPGVIRKVNELLDCGQYEIYAWGRTLIALRRMKLCPLLAG